jgi:membrane associated rhomboid family serine protease
MGIENREYYRDSSNFGGYGDGLSPVCKWLLIITVVIFVSQILISRKPTAGELKAYADLQAEIEEELIQLEEDGFDEYSEEVSKAHQKRMPPPAEVSIVQEWLELDTDKVMHGQIWRMLTCAFVHNPWSVWHIFFNMLFLYWFGVTLESMYRGREFLYFYLTAAFFASLAYVALDLYTGDYRPAIGASGAVMGVVMLYAIHYPRDRIHIYFLFPVEVRFVVLFYVIFDLHPVLLQLGGHEVYSGTGHAAHLGGLAFGFIYWRSCIRLERYYDRFLLPIRRLFGGFKANRRGLRVYDPVDEKTSKPQKPKTRHERRFDAQLDDILDKIHKEGEDSLTDAERKFLVVASERYRSDDDS